ncbi:MAG: ATP-binding protein [Solirubrobacterales bacterium]
MRGAFLEELSRLEDFLISVTAIRTVQPPGLAQLEIRTITSEVAREAILNAVAHRDYFIRQGVVVAVHRSGVEVTNPGGFIGGVTPDNVLHHRAVHRNELLARAFQNLRLVDRVGMGVNRMYEGLLRSGARPPSFEADQGSVSVRLPTDASDDFVAWIYEHERRNGPLSLNDLVVLRRVTDAGTLDRWTAAHQLQLDEHSAADHLAEMRSRGLLVARGRGRGTSYVLPRPLSERLRGRAATDADRPLEMEGVRLKVLELLREREHLTNAEIRDFSGYSRAQVLAIEKDLERQGLIEIKGRGRGAHIVLAPPE